MTKLKKDYIRISRLDDTYIMHTGSRVEVSRNPLISYEALIVDVIGYLHGIEGLDTTYDLEVDDKADLSNIQRMALEMLVSKHNRLVRSSAFLENVNGLIREIRPEL